MLQTIRIYGKGDRYDSMNVCNVVMTYELVEYTYQEKLNGEKDYTILHRVQLEPTTDSTFTIDCPLDDSDALTHFENLLSSKLGHVTVHTGVAA